MTGVDRKALTRAYKESRRPMGVYRVRNIKTGRSLVGVSIDLPSILNRHRAQLRLKAHSNRALQSDWDQLGPDAFAFEILDTLTPIDRPDYDPTEDLRALGDLWIERLSPFGERGYDSPTKR
jgi:hypothetical protein